ncbi:hypothetical protein Mgra_00006112 [Meloidogyne graminicola]|uniref:Uncharacterized protein n=1 Tax=Meloidogyne graminicola TaxID=189291 RepID=A0A8S9ZMZ0_9BILA|nr:hypothetical protein Mgra_00006112 [Meloidogyne graminicola]
MHVHFVEAHPPPPSYEQAVVECRSPFGGSINSSLIIENGEITQQRVEAQSEIIREQEVEIGKLKRDLGKIREHVERMTINNSLKQPTNKEYNDKFTQRLVNIVDEEAEERRRKNRSRKGDILKGSICCFALLAVVLAGFYIVLSRPNHFGSLPTIPSVEQFQILGKTANNFCSAQGVIQGKILNCNIFRRSRFNTKLFCEFSIGENDGIIQINDKRIIANKDKQKGVIIIQEESIRKRRELNKKSELPSKQTLLYTLNEAETKDARKVCTDQLLLPKIISSTQTRKLLTGRWNAKNNKKINWPISTTTTVQRRPF